MFEGTTLPWPETAAGEAVTVSCRSGNATRQCSIEGVWQDPDTDFCGGLATDINVLTSNVSLIVNWGITSWIVQTFSGWLKESEPKAKFTQYYFHCSNVNCGIRTMEIQSFGL